MGEEGRRGEGRGGEGREGAGRADEAGGAVSAVHLRAISHLFARSFAKREFSTAEGTGIKVINGLSSVQGPNYALAKTSQQWRAMVAKADGAVVSANHAPAARTESMVGYATIAAALEGMQSFPPLVAYDPGTACDMMAAILLWDLTDSKSLASPKNPGNHPTDLLAENACHGGIWRCAYDMESVNTASFLFGRFQPSYTPAGSLSI